MDVLHPSSVLNWNNILKWEHINPTCCALLEKVLCIVSRKPNEGDRIHYCSTNEWKWKSKPTNYEYSSLTTYKSKFVSIGGYDHLQRTMSNEIKVLNIGLEYESSSIPPLKSQRYRVSSVSIKLENTEYLIVAGGQNNNHQEEYFVEVLIESEWVTVRDELPLHCSSLKWALYKSDVFFLSGRNLIHCDWKTLVLKPAVEMNRWKMMNVGHCPATVVSYGRRLATIDEEATVRAHATTDNTWKKVKSKNNTNSSIVHDKIAAIPLTVEKLILAYGDDAVYEIQLTGSVSGNTQLEYCVKHGTSTSVSSKVSETEQTNLKLQLQEYQVRLEDLQRRNNELHRKLLESEQRANELARKANNLEKADDSSTVKDESFKSQQPLNEATQTIKKSGSYSISFNAHWVVSHDEIELTRSVIEVGSWATISEAKFRGVKVAAKRIHSRSKSSQSSDLYLKQMEKFFRLHHPRLVQFIGATVEGDKMILTELMTTSLKKQLQEEKYFQPKIVKSIGLDMAQGLNFLHQVKPDPVIHGNIKPTNILLEELPRGMWRAKLTDCISLHLSEFDSSNCSAYAAPEATACELRSTKIDIYSFGVLILEMLTGCCPSVEERHVLLSQVRHEHLAKLMSSCLSEISNNRPSADAIILELSS